MCFFGRRFQRLVLGFGSTCDDSCFFFFSSSSALDGATASTALSSAFVVSSSSSKVWGSQRGQYWDFAAV